MKAKIQTKAPAITPEKINAMVMSAAEKIVADLAPKVAGDALKGVAKEIVERLVGETVKPILKECLQDELASGEYAVTGEVSQEDILRDCQPLADRIASLENRLAALESQAVEPVWFDSHQAAETEARTETDAPAEKVAPKKKAAPKKKKA